MVDRPSVALEGPPLFVSAAIVLQCARSRHQPHTISRRSEGPSESVRLESQPVGTTTANGKHLAFSASQKNCICWPRTHLRTLRFVLLKSPHS
jgi:hypothetical protein